MMMEETPASRPMRRMPLAKKFRKIELLGQSGFCWTLKKRSAGRINCKRTEPVVPTIPKRILRSPIVTAAKRLPPTISAVERTWR